MVEDAHSQYLERHLRVALEGLVEALLAQKPDDSAGFSAEWLSKWHETQGNARAEAELTRLRAEHTKLLQERQALQAAFAKQRSAAKAVDSEEAEKIKKMKDSDRRAGVSAPSMSEEKKSGWTKPVFEKSPEEKTRIKGIIDSNEKLKVLFGHLTEGSVFEVIEAMKSVDIEKGTDVIVQGEDGDNFYIVDSGSFDIFVRRPTEANSNGEVSTKVMECGPGAVFGELALMYNAPRQATVTATFAGRVWALDQESFQMMLATAENTKQSQYEEFLEGIPTFAAMTKFERCQLSDALEPELFDEGEVIIEQGVPGTSFYILEDGHAKAYMTRASGGAQKDEGQEQTAEQQKEVPDSTITQQEEEQQQQGGEEEELEVRTYSEPGDIFGEVSLITSSMTKATVRAVNGGCTVLRLSGDCLDELLAPIRETLRKKAELYQSYESLSKAKAAEAAAASSSAA